MFVAAVAAILISMFLALSRAFIGPTLYDRILSVNMFGTKTVILISLLGFMMGRPEFLDIALVYALINFISIIGILRFFEYAESAPSSSQESRELDTRAEETEP